MPPTRLADGIHGVREHADGKDCGGRAFIVIDNLRIPPQVEINHVRAQDDQTRTWGPRSLEPVVVAVPLSAFVHVMSIPAVNAVNA